MKISTICHVLNVQRSSYYAWVKRPESRRAKENAWLVKQLKVLHAKSRGTYGAPRLTEQLRGIGHVFGRNRIANLMQKEGIFGCARRKFRVIPTTDSKHNLPVAPRIFKVEEPESRPTGPNQVWVSDTTYIQTGEGWLFLTIQLDVFSRKIVGYDFSNQLISEHVWESLRQGIRGQPEALSTKYPQLIVHSDRGRQYASDLYRNKLKRLEITQSMSRSGNCYDNAYAESFFHTLKVELVHRNKFNTRAQATEAIVNYIETWYNPHRLHSGIGYLAPNDYERQALAA